MATTTPNFGWSVPTSSDLVKNGATAIETLGDSIDASMAELLGGTTGQVLSKTSNTSMDFTWIASGATSGPAFSAYRATSNQTFTASTFTKVQFNAETFDTANNFDSTTNYRFTPTTSGYYQMSSNLTYDGTNSSSLKEIFLYKNGSNYATLFSTAGSGVAGATACQGSSTLVFFNGSTDYAEVYIYDTDAVVCAVKFGSTRSYFTGVWIRS